jgi:uncharacterized protein (DUF433 family)
MNLWDQCTAVERDPAKASGAWVFAKTRVPVRALFENLEDGAALKSSLSGFRGSQESRLRRFLISYRQSKTLDVDVHICSASRII